MSTDTLPSATALATPTSAPKPARDRFEQDQGLANALTEASRFITTALTTPDLAAALVGSGYTTDELNAGKTLVEIAQAKFAGRQSALAALAQTRMDRDKMHAVAKDDFQAYRVTVQVNYTGPARAALGADGKISADKERFISNARSAYTAGAVQPHAGVLAKNGFHETRFKEVMTNLDGFAAADSAFKIANRNSERATVERDEAAAALDAWMRKFKKLSKIALKQRPELRAALGI